MMIFVAIAALLVLASIAVFATVGRRQGDKAIGMLSNETRKRDATSTALGAETTLTGKQIEKAAALERRAASQELVLSGSGAPPAPYLPPDPETVGVSRRQFFNRTIVLGFGLGL